MKALWTIGLLVCGGSVSWIGMLGVPGWGWAVPALQQDGEWRSPADGIETAIAPEPFAKTTVKGESAPSDPPAHDSPNSPSDPGASHAPGAADAPNLPGDPDFPGDADTAPIPAEGGLVGQSEGDRPHAV